MIGAKRLARMAGAYLGIAGLALAAGCDWEVSRETKDLSVFQTFHYKSRGVSDPEDLVIQAQGDGVYTFAVGRWNSGLAATVYDEPQAMTSQQISQMLDLFRDVVVVTRAYAGNICLPVGISYSLTWDDFVIHVIGCQSFGELMVIEGDRSSQIREFVRDLAGVAGPP